MGTFIFHIVINDLLLQMTRNSERSIYNYADDSTASICDKAIDGIHNKLTEVSILLLVVDRNLYAG